MHIITAAAVVLNVQSIKLTFVTRIQSAFKNHFEIKLWIKIFYCNGI